MNELNLKIKRQPRKKAKEFYAPINKETLAENYGRLLKDCKEKTLNEYLLRFYRMLDIQKLFADKKIKAPKISILEKKRQYNKQKRKTKLKTTQDFINQLNEQSAHSFQNHLLDNTAMIAQHTNLGDRIIKAINDVEQKRQENKIKFSSFRLYKATICAGLSVLYAMTNEPTLVPKKHRTFLHFFTIPSDDFLQSQYDVALAWQREPSKVAKTKDKKAHLLAQTSTTKAKGFHEVFYDTVLNYQDNDGKLPYLKFLQNFVYLNCIFGLRPSEWFTARVVEPSDIQKDLEKQAGLGAEIPNLQEPLLMAMVDNQIVATNVKHPYWLRVTNAKNSLGRACGKYRYLSIPEKSEVFDSLTFFMKEIHEFKQKINQESNSQNVELTAQDKADIFYQGLLEPSSRLLNKIIKNDINCMRYANKIYKAKLRYYQQENQKSRMPPVVELPTLYSTRHQAVANAKADGLDDITIASMFGHISTQTADLHYGKTKTGGSRASVFPHLVNISIVLANLPPKQQVKLIFDCGLENHYIKGFGGDNSTPSL